MMFAIAAAVFLISFIQLVTSQCTRDCQTCSDINKCSSCKVGHWGANFGCVNTCSDNCANSNCDDNGYCYACANGMYGPNCNQDCQLCKNGKCGLRECTSGCKDGYYQYISGDYYYCYPCYVSCQQCLNSSYCTLCNDGYYIDKYTQTYTPKRGIALCNECQYNTVCDNCSELPNCLQCSYGNNQITCEHCREGYMLDNNHQCFKYMPCSTDCLAECTPNGDCYACRDGRTGRTCTFGCYERCANCSQTNQYLCEACKNGFYTSACDISCPQNCANRQCDFNNGSCLNGCLSGFWGDKCEDRCSDRCMQSECNRDGTCSHGCTAAYDGFYCNITTTTTKTTLLTSSLTSGLVPSNTRSESSTTTTKTTVLTSYSSSEIGTSNTRSESSTGVFTVIYYQEGRASFAPVIGGAVTGAIVITALLVGSIAFFLHRRSVSMTRNKEQRTDTMYYNTVVRSSVNEETGQNINKASEMGTTQTLEISVYDQLSRTNTEHEYSGL